jgi:hypothetical protein
MASQAKVLSVDAPESRDWISGRCLYGSPADVSVVQDAEAWRIRRSDNPLIGWSIVTLGFAGITAITGWQVFTGDRTHFVMWLILPIVLGIMVLVTLFLIRVCWLVVSTMHSREVLVWTRGEGGRVVLPELQLDEPGEHLMGWRVVIGQRVGRAAREKFWLMPIRELQVRLHRPGGQVWVAVAGAIKEEDFSPICTAIESFSGKAVEQVRQGVRGQ